MLHAGFILRFTLVCIANQHNHILTHEVSASRLLRFEDKDTHRGKNIGHQPGKPGITSGDRVLFQNSDIQAFAQFPEIVERAKVNVGRIIPLERHLGTARHFTAESDLTAAAPMPEVDNTYRSPFTDFDDLFEQEIGAAGFLQRMAQHREIK